VERLTETLCGPHRPGHFEGVATVCARLFGLVGPCVAVFGRKDYQQWKVVARMVRDLALPVDVVGHPTVREPDGLARSSRNAYLGADARRRARVLAAGLADAWDAFANGERRAGALRMLAAAPVAEVADATDYVAVADPEELAVLPDDTTTPDRVLVAVAARLEGTRLIDNVVLGEDVRPVLSSGQMHGVSP
jgi:pantoate--beta-alanine ligase